MYCIAHGACLSLTLNSCINWLNQKEFAWNKGIQSPKQIGSTWRYKASKSLIVIPKKAHCTSVTTVDISMGRDRELSKLRFRMLASVPHWRSSLWVFGEVTGTQLHQSFPRCHWITCYRRDLHLRKTIQGSTSEIESSRDWGESEGHGRTNHTRLECRQVVWGKTEWENNFFFCFVAWRIPHTFTRMSPDRKNERLVLWITPGKNSWIHLEYLGESKLMQVKVISL